MKYQYILLDIDSTLIDFKSSFDGAAKQVLALGKHPVTPDSIAEYFHYNDAMWFGLNLNQIEREDIRTNYHSLYINYLHQSNLYAQEKMNLQADIHDLVECFMDNLGSCAVPSPHALKVCEILSKTHTLCVATNGLMRIQPGKITQFRPYMTNTYISEAIGKIKPEKEYFDFILNHLACNPSQCLMVGDSLENDINGANLSGIDSCFYNPQKSTNSSAILPTYEIHDFYELLKIV